jgi:hypothetical protein
MKTVLRERELAEKSSAENKEGAKAW